MLASAEILLNPAVLATVFAVGVFLYILALAPPRWRSPFTQFFSSRRGVVNWLRNELHLAGVFEAAPAFVLVATLLVGLVVGAVLVMFSGTIYVLPVGPIAILTSGFLYLERQQRRYLKRAQLELVQFLNRIQAAARSGSPPQLAFIEAVNQSRTLRQALGDAVSAIETGTPFIQALSATIDRLPFYSWYVFVRQMEIFEQSGGRLDKALSVTIRHINTTLQLQAQARSDSSAQRLQQRFIVLIVFGALGFWAFVVDPESSLKLVTTAPGRIILVLGLLMMFTGIFISRKLLRSIDRKIGF